jgi:hypothetical protein
MMGSEDIGSPEAGLIPRICCEALRSLSDRSGPSQGSALSQRLMSYVCSVSFIEIYNERVYDLLSSTPESACKVRAHPELGAFVEGITKEEVRVYTDIERVLEEGRKRRRVAETIMNTESSRSHAVFVFNLVQNLRVQSASGAYTEAEKVSKINLVDLAGSERIGLPGASAGDKLMREAGSINRSLSVLGDVIKALSERGSTSRGSIDFIPYRNSVLTYLLKDSLGGNSRTTMLATISPIQMNFNESLSTLKYLERCKMVVNSVGVNVKTAMESPEYQKLLQQVDMYKSQNEKLTEHIMQLQESNKSKFQAYKEETEANFKNRLMKLTRSLSMLDEKDTSTAVSASVGKESEGPSVDSSVPRSPDPNDSTDDYDRPVISLL